MSLKTEYELWKIGEFVFSTRTYCLQQANNKQRLRANEAKLLTFLILHFDPPEEDTKKIISAVWGEGGSKSSLHKSIEKLRKAFGGDTEEYIATGPYRLVLEPRPIVLDAEAPPGGQISPERTTTVPENPVSEEEPVSERQETAFGTPSIGHEQVPPIVTTLPERSTLVQLGNIDRSTWAPFLDATTHGHSIYLSFAKAIALTCVLLTVNWLGEITVLGRNIKLATYGLLQHRLSSAFHDGDLPIVVVDISDLPQSSSNENKNPYTSRPVLRQLIAAAAGSGARAIGIAVDFSPDQNGYISSDDSDFFQYCLQIKKITGIPIFLGIYRSQAMPSSTWLGEEQYKELAATIIGPRDSRRMIRWFQMIDHPQRSFSIGASLAGAFNDSLHKPNFWLFWAMRSESDVKEQYFSAKEFWVDYGPLDAFKEHAFRMTDVTGDQSRRLQGKIVLFGDVASGRTRDTFVVPGRRDPVPGTLAHACAAYTLLNEPLYTLTFLGRIASDLFISLIIIGGMLIIRVTFWRRGRRTEVINNLQTLFIIMIAAMVILIGWGLVDKDRLMWDDCFLVAVVLLAYKPAAHGLGYLGHVAFKIWQILSPVGESYR